MLSDIQKNHFAEQGFIIFKDPSLIAIKETLKTELKKISLALIQKSELLKNRLKEVEHLSFKEIFDWTLANEKDQVLSRAFYEVFPTSPAVISWISHPFFLSLANSLGITYPLASTLPLLRIDRGGEKRFSTPVHQDFWFAMLSPNCLTYWLPILPIDKEMGPLWIIPQSQKYGVLPIKPWSAENPYTAAREFQESEFSPVLLEDDEVLVFHQCLVHKSGENRSTKARLTLQLRYNDLETLSQPTSSYTVTHSRYTKEAQKKLLDESSS